jgi:phosphoserine phosphatase
MFKPFSPEFKERLYSEIESLVAKSTGPVYAAFDADGTLWDFDLGETFFHYQIQNSRLNLPRSPLQYYLDMKAKNPQQAYLWLAQINQGKSIDQVRTWAEECVQKYGNLPIFPDVRELIEFLKSKNVIVYVVTASIKWAVEPGAKRLGIPFDQVLGVQTKIINGLVSDQQEGEITYRHGKPLALLNSNQGVDPILCAGNTTGDLQLLESSIGIKLALGSSGAGEDIHATESELANIAKERGWFYHKFRN